MSMCRSFRTIHNFPLGDPVALDSCITTIAESTRRQAVDAGLAAKFGNRRIHGLVRRLPDGLPLSR